MCKICSQGYYCLNNQRLICDFGSYSSFMGQYSCEVCQNGTYTETQGSTDSSQCLLCPAGTYKPINSSSCSNCPFGTFNSQFGKTSCENCLNGICTSGSQMTIPFSVLFRNLTSGILFSSESFSPLLNPISSGFVDTKSSSSSKFVDSRLQFPLNFRAYGVGSSLSVINSSSGVSAALSHDNLPNSDSLLSTNQIIILSCVLGTISLLFLLFHEFLPFTLALRMDLFRLAQKPRIGQPLINYPTLLGLASTIAFPLLASLFCVIISSSDNSIVSHTILPSSELGVYAAGRFQLTFRFHGLSDTSYYASVPSSAKLCESHTFLSRQNGFFGTFTERKILFASKTDPNSFSCQLELDCDKCGVVSSGLLMLVLPSSYQFAEVFIECMYLFFHFKISNHSPESSGFG